MFKESRLKMTLEKIEKLRLNIEKKTLSVIHEFTTDKNSFNISKENFQKFKTSILFELSTMQTGKIYDFDYYIKKKESKEYTIVINFLYYYELVWKYELPFTIKIV